MDLRSFIKPCQPEQIPAVLKLLEDTELIFPCDSPASFAAQLAHDPESILVFERDGSVVGCLFVLYNPFLTTMYHLAVLPAQRGRGFGKALILEAEDRVRRRGTAAIASYVVSSNEPSLRLVDRLGYECDPRPITCVSKLV